MSARGGMATAMRDGRLADAEGREPDATERGRRDWRFVGLVLLASVAVPGLLLLLAPFTEARAALGVALGWGLGLVMIVPSYFVVSRTVASRQRVFQTAFVLSTLGRMALGLAGLLLFLLLVHEPPVLSFMTALGLAYVTLTAIELRIALEPAPEDRTR